jgi:NADP-dependent 3-hydroxy acid dehydrogenase YdfG
MSLLDKVVAITGASSGIGEATARLLAARGAAVVLGARRIDRLDQAADELRAHGASVLTVTTDVTRREDLQHLVTSAVDEFGRLDVLVSNAGVASLGPVADGDVDGWLAMVDVNLHGVLYGIAATKNAVRTFMEALRQESTDGVVRTTSRSATSPSARPFKALATTPKYPRLQASKEPAVQGGDGRLLGLAGCQAVA